MEEICIDRIITRIFCKVLPRGFRLLYDLSSFLSSVLKDASFVVVCLCFVSQAVNSLSQAVNSLSQAVNSL